MYQVQKQKQLSKQAQLRDQNFSNQIMLNCLAALENLAYFYGYQGPRIFDYYSGYAPRNNENSLIDAIIMQLEVFRTSYSNYSSIYGNYDFPKNLTKDQIIKIVLDWENYIPHYNIKVFYDEIINYLNGSSDTSGISGIIEKKKKEWGPTTEKQLSRIAKATPFINSRMHNEKERVKQSYQNGNYEIKAKLYQNQNDDVEMADLNKNDQKTEQLIKKFNETEKKIAVQYQLNDTRNQLNNTKSQLSNAMTQLQYSQSTLDTTRSELNNVQYQFQNYQHFSRNSKNQLLTLQNENDNLKRLLTESNENYSSESSKIFDLQNEIKNIKAKNEHYNQKIIKLKTELKLKCEETQKLNAIFARIEQNLNFPLNVNFRSMDGFINCSIFCYYNELVAVVEERLYQYFPMFRNPNNALIYNGTRLEKNKSVILNGIANNGIILIVNTN